MSLATFLRDPSQPLTPPGPLPSGKAAWVGSALYSASLQAGLPPEVEVVSARHWGEELARSRAGLGEVLVTQGGAGGVPGGWLGQIQGKGSAAELLRQMGVTDVQDL